MTRYCVTLKSTSGQEFTRGFASMTARALFTLDAAKLGAVPIREWVETGEAEA